MESFFGHLIRRAAVYAELFLRFHACIGIGEGVRLYLDSTHHGFPASRWLPSATSPLRCKDKLRDPAGQSIRMWVTLGRWFGTVLGSYIREVLGMRIRALTIPQSCSLFLTRVPNKLSIVLMVCRAQKFAIMY